MHVAHYTTLFARLTVMICSLNMPPHVDIGNDVDYFNNYDFSDEAAFAMANTRD